MVELPLKFVICVPGNVSAKRMSMNSENGVLSFSARADVKKFRDMNKSLLLEIGRLMLSSVPAIEDTPWSSDADSDFIFGSAVNFDKHDHISSLLFFQSVRTV